MPLKTENRTEIIIHTRGGTDTCHVSLTKGETIRLDIGPCVIHTAEVDDFCDALRTALRTLVEGAS